MKQDSSSSLSKDRKFRKSRALKKYSRMNRSFRSVEPAEYRPEAPPEDTHCFRHYNPSELVLGAPMAAWLKFSPCFFNNFSYCGPDDHSVGAFHHNPLSDDPQCIEYYKARLEASFEFFSKLGVEYYSISDRDLCPDFDDFEEPVIRQQEMCIVALDLQHKFNMRPLYFAWDLVSHPRYSNGASTSPNAHVYAYACAQVKHALEAAQRLGAENFVFFHPRDGYKSLIQRNVVWDLSHMNEFYRMVLKYREKINYNVQFLIQPKPFDNKRVQYESDTMTCIALLRNFGLESFFKLCIKPRFSRMVGRPYEHDVYMASIHNMLGMLDASENWPEASFTAGVSPCNIRDATSVMKCVVNQSGFERGGITLGFKKCREAIEPRDHFQPYILTMDIYACALKIAARIYSDGILDMNLRQRYMTFSSEIGIRTERGLGTLEDCEDFVKRYGPPVQANSYLNEYSKNLFNFYVFPNHQYYRRDGLRWSRLGTLFSKL